MISLFSDFTVCKSVELNTNANFDTTQLQDVSNRTIYNVDQFYITHSTIDFVEKKLNTLNTTKATGADYIHATFLKMSSSTIAPLLTYFFNCSVKQQIFLNVFKLAKVTPIYNKGEHSIKQL